MSDQVEIQIPKTIWPEETTFTATAYFRTRATKVALAPTTVHYRIDCLKTRKEIVDWTSVTTGANVDIVLTATHNQILEEQSRLERKQLTVQADQGLSTQVNGVVVYKIRNLQGIV